jgi:hypothetical protein
LLGIQGGVRIAAALLILLGGCATTNVRERTHYAFLENIRALAGQAFEGRVVTSDAADREMAGQRLIMHVLASGTDANNNSYIRIPFHVGADRSRTWVITETGRGLRLKHDHRHEDGSEDSRTQYGGDTAGEGTSTRQEFPADQYSKDLFVRENIPQSVTNVWAVEVLPGRTFAYELRRPGRHFRVEFDLTRPVAPPPPPWGAN